MFGKLLRSAVWEIAFCALFLQMCSHCGKNLEIVQCVIRQSRYPGCSVPVNRMCPSILPLQEMGNQFHLLSIWDSQKGQNRMHVSFFDSLNFFIGTSSSQFRCSLMDPTRDQKKEGWTRSFRASKWETDEEGTGKKGARSFERASEWEPRCNETLRQNVKMGPSPGICQNHSRACFFCSLLSTRSLLTFASQCWLVPPYTSMKFADC